MEKQDAANKIKYQMAIFEAMQEDDNIHDISFKDNGTLYKIDEVVLNTGFRMNIFSNIMGGQKELILKMQKDFKNNYKQSYKEFIQ